VAPDQSRVHAGLRRDDLFTVVLDQFMTDTARFADVVLPVTTQLEHLDALFSWGHHYITYNEPAIAPLGEAKPNTEVFRLLAAGLGLDDPCFRQTDEQLLEAVFERAPEAITLDRLQERGWLKVDLGQGPIPHADGGFGTPDGKVAFRADWLERLGLDPLPAFDPPAEVADEHSTARFPLALLTPKTHFFLNSTFANQARQHRAQPEPFVVVHPDDAANRDISDGDLVRVFNDRGECHLRAHISDDAPAGVVDAPASWRMNDHASEFGAPVTTSQRLTVLGRAPPFNDTRVEVAALTLPPLLWPKR
jgi:anaerobic selenocysteine-containing dehydrogenase